MQAKIRYPQSSARPIYVTVGLLGVLGLAGGIVMLVAMADVPKPAYYLLILAFGLLIVALTGSLAVLLATNTRRPWGIDPNIGPQFSRFDAMQSDPYGETTEDLLRHAIQLPDGKGYGRRQQDDTEVVRRLTSTSVPEERVRPPLPPPSRPAWADEMLAEEYRAEPNNEPRKELANEPREQSATARFPEVPLEQLDLLPANPADMEQGQRQANGESDPRAFDNSREQ
jgi:hypothetical protein